MQLRTSSGVDVELDVLEPRDHLRQVEGHVAPPLHGVALEVTRHVELLDHRPQLPRLCRAWHCHISSKPKVRCLSECSHGRAKIELQGHPQATSAPHCADPQENLNTLQAQGWVLHNRF